MPGSIGKNIRIFALSTISLALICYLYWLSGQEYRPAYMGQLAGQFVNFLQKENYTSAYDMTTKTPILGLDLLGFKKMVSLQLGNSTTVIDSAEINHIRTGQTYGNRLRRWLRARPVDVEQISVDCTIKGKAGSFILLFEVRFIRNSEKKWKISYFQSHAG